MKYYLISIILHSLFFILSIAPNIKSEEIKLTQKSTGNSQVESKNVQVVELIEGTTFRKLNNYYWGIGVSVDYKDITIGSKLTSGYKIDFVYKGYTAESSGILINDYIFLIDGKPIMGNNDIKGDEPKKMTLTILRNNVIINILIERTKIYY